MYFQPRISYEFLVTVRILPRMPLVLYLGGYRDMYGSTILSQFLRVFVFNLPGGVVVSVSAVDNHETARGDGGVKIPG